MWPFRKRQSPLEELVDAVQSLQSTVHKLTKKVEELSAKFAADEPLRHEINRRTRYFEELFAKVIDGKVHINGSAAPNPTLGHTKSAREIYAENKRKELSGVKLPG